MVMFLVLHPMESISLNSFVLLEHLAMLLTSTLAINCQLRNFLNKAIGIINFAGLKSLLRQGLSEHDFYGDLVYKLNNNLIIFQRSSLK